MSIPIKTVLKIGAPAAAAVITVTTLSILLYHRGKKIDSLQAQINEQSVPVQEESKPEFATIDVDHRYELYGQKILLSDDTFGQIWIPVLADVPLSRHPLEQMVMQDGKRMASFDKDGNLDAMTGIDVSSHNTVTDWKAVKADGIDFVMLRVGYRGYGVNTGTLKADDQFRAYYKGAKEAGLLVGAYFFSQAITEEEAAEEAAFTAELLKGCTIDFPVVYDWEMIFHDNEARTNNVPVDTLTDACLAFCQNIKAFGYQPMIYQNKRTSLFKLDLPRLQGIPFWLAEYGDGPTYVYDYDMWQYSCKGTVNGISGEVDMNLSFCDFSKENHPAVSIPAPADAKLPGSQQTTGTSTDASATDTATETTTTAE